MVSEEVESALCTLSDMLDWAAPMGPQEDLRWIGETSTCLYLVYLFLLNKPEQSTSDPLWLLVRNTDRSTYFCILCATEAQAKALASADTASQTHAERAGLRQQLNEFEPDSCLFWDGDLSSTYLNGALKLLKARCCLDDPQTRQYRWPEF